MPINKLLTILSCGGSRVHSPKLIVPSVPLLKIQSAQLSAVRFLFLHTSERKLSSHTI